MKKFFIAALAAMALFASCSKDEQPADVSTQGGNVTITFSGSDADTRAFFDNTAVAEEWEKELHSLSVFIYDASGDLVIRRDLTAAEVLAKTARLTVPRSAIGQLYSFYTVANFNVTGDVSTLAYIRTALEAAAEVYNGSFVEIIGAAKRTNGFTMTGTASQTIVNGTNNIQVSLKRTVAKVAVRAVVASDFSANFGGGMVRIDQAKVTRSAIQTPLFPAIANTGAMTNELTQTTRYADSNYDNLFYIYGNPATADNVTVSLVGIFDRDGNFDTTGDQTEVTYDIPLGSTTSGEVKRNNYYRLSLRINGLSGSSVDATITVADWDGPVTENHDLGD